MKMQIKTWINLLTVMGFIAFFILGCKKDDSTYTPTEARDFTTLARTVVPNIISPFPPQIYAYEISKYDLYGYGGWQYGPGVPCQKKA
ncbi:MAG: hypothetical protein WCI71_11565 [Bacteroidota bacterium]